MTTEAPTLKVDPQAHRAASGCVAPDRLGEAFQAPTTGGATLTDLETIASFLHRWRSRNRYYWNKKIQYLQFVIPKGESVLLFGCEDGQLLDALAPAHGVGVDRCSRMLALAAAQRGDHVYYQERDFFTKCQERFDYLVLNDVAGSIDDVFVFLQRLLTHCKPDARIIIVQHNYLWRPIFRVAELLRLKRRCDAVNWLSSGDLRTFLAGAGFETIDVRPKLHCPKFLFGLGAIINATAGVLPFVNRLASTEFLVARPAADQSQAGSKTATIVLTTRDERDNIEPMVRMIPDVGVDTEIVFVEGQSTDGTLEEIQRVIHAYPNRNIRLLVQDGIGQGDAIRKGFADARGDVIILLEADQTSPPEDVGKAFDIVATGRAEFVNGSRFVYPRDKGAMPLTNVVGNWLFALWFTWFLGQRTSDVLCGIKAIDKRQFHRLNRNWGFLGLFDPFGDFELAFGAARLGLKICEMPTRYACRQYGQPKSRVLKHGWMLARMALRATEIFKCH